MSSTYPTKPEFWKTYQYLILVGPDGAIRFTQEGRIRLGLFYRRNGIDIAKITTLSRFLECDALANALSADRAYRQKLEVSQKIRVPSEEDKAKLAEIFKDASSAARSLFPQERKKPGLRLVRLD